SSLGLCGCMIVSHRLEAICFRLMPRKRCIHRGRCRTAETITHSHEMLRRHQFFKLLTPEGWLASGGFAECFKERFETILFQPAAHRHDRASNLGRDFMRLAEREVFDTDQ